MHAWDELGAGVSRVTGVLVADAGTRWPLVPTTVSLAPRHRTQLIVLPPPAADAPLATVDIARIAEVKVFLRTDC